MKKIVLPIIAVLCIAVLSVSLYYMYTYVNGFYKNAHVNKVTLSLSEVKAGLQAARTKTIVTTDRQEIRETVNSLNKPVILKTLPDTGPAKVDQNDRLELRVVLNSDKNEILEYYITSEGDVNVNRGNDKHFFHTLIFDAKATKWFNDLKTLFIAKEQNSKWSKN